MYKAELQKQDRDEALRSLNERKLRAYMKKYRIKAPDNALEFWAGIHKARAQLDTMSLSERLASADWLREHGFQVPEMYVGRTRVA